MNVNFRSIIEKIKQKSGLNQKQIAEQLFGISDKNLSNRIKDNRIDFFKLIRWAVNKNVDLNSLLLDQNEKLSTIKDPKVDYRLHGDPPVFSWESFCEVPEGLDFPKTIDLLADIFRSKDEGAINSVKSNISEIAQRIELDSKLVALSERMDEAEKNIS